MTGEYRYDDIDASLPDLEPARVDDTDNVPTSYDDDDELPDLVDVSDSEDDDEPPRPDRQAVERAGRVRTGPQEPPFAGQQLHPRQSFPHLHRPRRRAQRRRPQTENKYPSSKTGSYISSISDKVRAPTAPGLITHALGSFRSPLIQLHGAPTCR